MKKYAGDLSLQESISADKESGSATLEDRIPDDSEPLADTVALKMQVERLYNVLGELDERELEIIRLRYGLCKGDEVTQREIGAMMNISRSYVSRIEKKALSKLSKALAR
ncbi:MAG: sigma-70 family RNA polymerase sigma factor [Defluviitaleaceae bacterium]|nr:sigma-70 family RNA polymerase sigma factor [Defluviitaleaceae bacterium]